MAEGRSNSGIAAAVVLIEGAVEKHTASIFAKLALDPVPETIAASSRCPATSIAGKPPAAVYAMR